MSNYTQNVFFGPKDSLISGDANKRIKGTELDAELAEIASTIASKEDSANKGVASGYASLGGDGLVPQAQLPVASDTVSGRVELATTAETTAGTDTVRATTPAGVKAAVDASVAALRGANAGLIGDLEALTDPNADRLVFWDDSAGAMVYLTVGSNLTLSGTTLSANTQTTTDASLLTTGTIPAARIGASGVTQHQAALSIAETQIVDGAIYARVGSTETITGAWTFSAPMTVNAITRSGKGAHLYYDASGNNGGAITVSTSAASGTPANGDLWLQYI